MNERWLVEELILVGLLKVVQQGATLPDFANMGAAEHLKTAARELMDQAPPAARPKIQRRVQATARRCISPSVTRDTHVATLGLAAYHLLEHLLDEGYVSIGTLSPLSCAIDMILPALEPAANDEEQMTDSRTTAIGIFQNLQKEGLFRGVVPMV
ncbi:MULTISPECIES: hypothetical protein [unclassified Aureimonas]|uniref:hypothetical protein n=1 Tax=unclassified Aureimonas TaxID=2615206 RepID=UPI0006F51C91|nr:MULTISPECIES: hypothetical protein [unclassified Aureimonas]KQT56122.1 hypothetical protein ASG62_25095 [Aureimonas sp. Leaf427]KQT60042.1 hypothetical protein ASG54_05610 [Aureimonas sp. Leaf460]